MKSRFSTGEIAEPYAQALMSIAQEYDLVDRIGEDVSALRETLQVSEDLQEFLESPLIKAEAKKNALRQICSETVHNYTLNFLMLLVDRGRILFLDAICQKYQARLRELKNIVLAQVTAAQELTSAQEDAVREKVKALTGAEFVELEISIDSDLIGGLIVRIGSQVLDASLRGQLRRLALSLS
ncbi:MAG: F0F1 ATP synthase subunit delta [Cyanobacteria bacterium SID2]|nr:F0F1 ATP synthase subunit delta [Cyanobacteria bacterium SID2]MBP0003580.1 F0F1 ATP synthase subunit delta [Cyanobacteria bacterium SBC]